MTGGTFTHVPPLATPLVAVLLMCNNGFLVTDSYAYRQFQDWALQVTGASRRLFGGRGEMNADNRYHMSHTISVMI